MSKLKDAFLDGTSSTYLEDLEERYHKDPNSVDKSWTSFFRSLGMLFDLRAIKADVLEAVANLCTNVQSKAWRPRQ